MLGKTSTKLFIAAVLVTGGARAQATPAEQSYVQEAQTINQAELALGQLAQQRGSSDEVKQMSRTMVERHSVLSAQLAELARERAIASAPQPSTDDEQVYDRLAKLSGKSFDEAFKQAVADAHTRESRASPRRVRAQRGHWATRLRAITRERTRGQHGAGEGRLVASRPW